MAAIASGVAFGAAPAAAHDSLLASDPADGATLDGPPDAVTLTYSADVAEEFVRAAVTVPGGEPEALPPEAFGVSGPELVVDLSEVAAQAPAGAWAVVVRIVSVDGHPVEEEIRFDAAAGDAPASPGVATSPAAGPDATAAGSPAPTAAASTDEPSRPNVSAAAPEQRVDEGASPVTPWVIAAAVVAALAVAGRVILLRRRR